MGDMADYYEAQAEKKKALRPAAEQLAERVRPRPKQDIAGSEQLREQIEQLYDEWFYKFATEEPDGTYTLVIHEVNDGDAYTKFEQLILDFMATHDTEKKQEVLKAIGEDFVSNIFDDRWYRTEGENGHITHYETAKDAKMLNERNTELRQAVEEIYSQGGE